MILDMTNTKQVRPHETSSVRPGSLEKKELNVATAARLTPDQQIRTANFSVVIAVFLYRSQRELPVSRPNCLILSGGSLKFRRSQSIFCSIQYRR